ncbi:MAG TPA: glycoside hydrolase family 15 protein [Candidatus Limnocylindria bacterium]|nr:glycoside hydrolase family 15 protein [Candidatus Limnocylindria bacterium]
MTGTSLDLAGRSVEVILANQTPSGAFIASPTFSQYGYCWLRDGAFIAHALDVVGEHAAAARFHDWVSGVVLARRDCLERAGEAGRHGRPPRPEDYLHCRYSADGAESAVEWPSFQLDGPGIWLWSLGEHLAHGGELTPARAEAAGLVADYLAALWLCPSYDAWEEHPEHVHTSTVGAIATGVRAAGRYLASSASSPRSVGRSGSADLAASAELMVQNLRDTGAEGHLPKWRGNDAVDGSLLWLGYPFRAFRVDDPIFAATLRRIEVELVSDEGAVYRYLQDTYYGGGEWLLLTAALGSVYAERDAPGDRQRALRCLEWIERQADSDGQLPEQVAERALHAEWIEDWVSLWGPSARPLLWAHAAYLVLRRQLEASTSGA